MKPSRRATRRVAPVRVGAGTYWHYGNAERPIAQVRRQVADLASYQIGEIYALLGNMDRALAT